MSKYKDEALKDLVAALRQMAVRFYTADNDSLEQKQESSRKALDELRPMKFSLAYQEAEALYQQMFIYRTRGKRRPVISRYSALGHFSEDVFKVKDYLGVFINQYNVSELEAILLKRIAWVPEVSVSENLRQNPDSPEDVLLGLFTGRQGNIVVYAKGIDSYCRKYGLEAEHREVFGMVLAHEYFHAIHRCFDYRAFQKQSIPGISHSKVKLVTEALADFFAVSWLRYQGTDACHKVANQRIELWSQRQSDGWPYAAASVFLDEPELFGDVLTLLKINPPLGYRMLKGQY